jgi:hypothetical protein
MSAIIWGILAGMFISSIYVASKIINHSPALASATWMQRNKVMVGSAVLLVPLVVGFILVNAVFGRTEVVRTKHLRPAARKDPTILPPMKPEPLLKLVISDGSKETDIAALNQCASDEVTLIQNGTIQCVTHESPQVKAWMEDQKRQEALLLKKYVKYQARIVQNKGLKNLPAMQPAVMKQGFSWLAPASGGSDAKVAVQKETVQKPFKDRNAELFYFLALVFGVLGKYFWDYYEERRGGAPVKFEPHLIVMSFIIAALVYYSIQQGIEKEAGTLKVRGVMFAFNNGFMWQTILTSMNRSRNDGQAAATDEKPAA